MSATRKKSVLGKITKTASLSLSDVEKFRIMERYTLQSFARELLPNHRVCVCCRFLSHNAENVKIVYRPHKRVSGFKGLARCSCLWVCPVCGSVISEQRKSELKRATMAHRGAVVMLSYTLRHTHQNVLEELLKVLDTAFRGFLAGSYGEDFRRDYGVIGTVRALEVTHGGNGWHPHIHQLIFMNAISDLDIEALTDELKSRWVNHVRRAGGHATYRNGLDVRKDADYIAGYVAKFGHAPTREVWGLEHELAKSVSKKGRNGGRSPLQLLADYGEGDKYAGRLFQEYASNFFGRRHLIWSRGLKERLGVDVLTDEEVMENEEKDGNFRVLAVLSGQEWRVVRERKFQAVLLILAMNDDAFELERFLVDNGIRSVGNGTQEK